MTVMELKKCCETAIENGYAYSDIILCFDEDEFRSLNSGFSSPVNNRETTYDFIEDNDYDENDVIVLN